MHAQRFGYRGSFFPAEAIQAKEVTYDNDASKIGLYSGAVSRSRSKISDCMLHISTFPFSTEIPSASDMPLITLFCLCWFLRSATATVV